MVWLYIEYRRTEHLTILVSMHFISTSRVNIELAIKSKITFTILSENTYSLQTAQHVHNLNVLPVLTTN